MKWEYKVVKLKESGWFVQKFDVATFEKILNDLGEEGWELVRTTTTQLYGCTSLIVAFLRREK